MTWLKVYILDKDEEIQTASPDGVSFWHVVMYVGSRLRSRTRWSGIATDTRIERGSVTERERERGGERRERMEKGRGERGRKEIGKRRERGEGREGWDRR